MAEAAQAAKSQGIRVLVGYIDPNSPEEVVRALEGLKILPVTADGDLDLDEALSQKPDLILIDELAHINGDNSRHRNRYQEVEELLESGIDVYTTVNVGDIESLRDTVSSITGTLDRESIPDSIFDQADQVELIDLEPNEVIKHFQDGENKDSYISVEQLAALREITLRRSADRIRRRAESLQDKKSFHTGEHILVCLSSAPSNAKIIRTAARMARAFNSQFTALFVESPGFASDTEDNKRRLQENQRLAEQLGATIETVYGEDIPYQIAEYARLSGITKIVLGRSTVTRRHLFGKPVLTDLLLTYAPEIDIHIIPDPNAGMYRIKTEKYGGKKGILKNTLMSIGILLGATLLSLLFHSLGFTDSNIIMVYILGVLLTSVATSRRMYSLISAIASVFIFNFLFTLPRFSLSAYGTGYPVTFVVMFLTAYITGTFAILYKEQAGQTAKIAYRTKILFDTNQILSKANGRDEIIHAAAEQMMRLLNRNIVIFDNEDGELSQPRIFRVNDDKPYDTEKELSAAKWVLKQNRSAGAATDTFSDAGYMYLAIQVNGRVYGVAGIETEGIAPDAFEHSILLSILGETALALENERNAREKKEAALMAEREQLRANLLRTISHDLRTPLTTISGNAGALLDKGNSFDEDTRRQIYKDIYDDSMWLIGLVENLLYTTRIEDGRMALRLSAELLSEIIEAAARNISTRTAEHKLSFSCPDDMLFVKADARLVVQVINNLADNAIKYTPPGSEISLTAEQVGDMAEISIADTGKGIADSEKEKVFEKFYCGDKLLSDHRRSLGLGLYLCKVIVEAHGGEIRVTDNHPHGAVFSFTLPLMEVATHE